MKGNMPKKLIKNAFFLTSAAYITMFANAILTIALARYLGAKGLGVYTTVFTFVFFGTIISSFGLSPVIMREIAKNNLLAETYFVNGLFITLIFSFICWMFINGVVFLMEYPAYVKILIFIGGFSILTGAVADTCNSIFRAFEKMGIPSLVASGTSIISSITGIVLLWKGFGLFPIISMIVAGSGLNAIIMLFLLRKYLKNFKNINIKVSFEMLKQSFPVALMRTFNTLTHRVDILMLSGMKGMTSVGLYSAPVKFINVISVPLQSLGGASLPRLSAQSASSLDKLQETHDKLLKYFFLLSLPLTVIVFLLADNLIDFIFGKEYISGGSAIALRILILGFLFNITSGPAQFTIFTSQDRLNRFVPFMLAITILNIILNILLIPKYDFLGASISTLICYIVGLFTRVMLVRRMFEKSDNLLSISKKPVLATLLMVGPIYFLRDSSWVLAGVTGFIAYVLILFVLGEFKDWGINVSKRF